MSKEVDAAIGTQRQFAKQPELPYALRLDPLRASAGISQRVDYDAQLLAKSLGVVGTGFLNLNAAIEKGKQENATLINADKILAGKTKEDLQKFDRMSALQHIDGHNLSHNKYAMAALEQGIGKMASTYAKQQWANMPEAQRPKSVAEAVQLYNQLLQENYNSFGDNIKNRTAFDKGYYDGAIQDTMKVANEADQRINDEKHEKMMGMSNVQIQDLIFSKANGQEFFDGMSRSIRELELGAKDRKEFKNAMMANLALIAETDYDGSRLKALENISVFGGTKLKEMISFAPYKQKIGQRCSKEIARQAYEKYKLPNGGFNWEAYNKDKKNRPQGMFKNSIPLVDIPISAGDNPDLENISPELKGITSKIGGILFNLGYGDVMQLTSGYRSPEHNRAVGGVEGSKHTTGEALDIYLGDLSAEQQTQLKQTLAPYFRFVDFHNAGSGDHLHLGSYQGGLDNIEDPEDMSYGAYAPDRGDNIDREIRSMVTRDKQAYRDQQQQIKNDVVSKMFQSKDVTEAYSIIDNSSLSPKEKLTMKNSVDSYFKKQDAAKRGLLKGDALKIANYENPMNSQNVFADMAQAEIYRTRLAAHMKDEADDKGKTEFTMDEQEKYNAVARRLCWYWSKVYGNQKQTQQKPASTQQTKETSKSPTPSTPPTSSNDEEGRFTKELKEVVEGWKKQNYSDVQIDAYLEKYAKKNNMDVSQLKMLLGRK